MTSAFKKPSPRHDISLYKNSNFVGYGYPNTIEEIMKRYRKSAEASAEHISWDNVVLYAVFDYAPRSLSISSVNFMMSVVKYEDYRGLIDRLAGTKRFFFIRGRKEYKYE